jgi:hypothetical protein
VLHCGKKQQFPEHMCLYPEMKVKERAVGRKGGRAHRSPEGWVSDAWEHWAFVIGIYMSPVYE